MKTNRFKIIIPALLLAIVFLMPQRMSAQNNGTSPALTNGIPSTPQSFVTSTIQYFTMHNQDTNINFGSKIELWTGTAYQSGINFADDVGVRFKLHPASSGFAFEGDIRNAGIAGTIVSAAAGGAYILYSQDIEWSAGANVGYRFQNNSPLGIVYADVRKMLTQNTFSGLRIAFEGTIKKDATVDRKIPTITVILGTKLF